VGRGRGASALPASCKVRSGSGSCSCTPKEEVGETRPAQLTSVPNNPGYSILARPQGWTAQPSPCPAHAWKGRGGGLPSQCTCVLTSDHLSHTTLLRRSLHHPTPFSVQPLPGCPGPRINPAPAPSPRPIRCVPLCRAVRAASAPRPRPRDFSSAGFQSVLQKPQQFQSTPSRSPARPPARARPPRPAGPICSANLAARAPLEQPKALSKQKKSATMPPLMPPALNLTQLNPPARA